MPIDPFKTGKVIDLAKHRAAKEAWADDWSAPIAWVVVVVLSPLIILSVTACWTFEFVAAAVDKRRQPPRRQAGIL